MRGHRIHRTHDLGECVFHPALSHFPACTLPTSLPPCLSLTVTCHLIPSVSFLPSPTFHLLPSLPWLTISSEYYIPNFLPVCSCPLPFARDHAAPAEARPNEPMAPRGHQGASGRSTGPLGGWGAADAPGGVGTRPGLPSPPVCLHMDHDEPPALPAAVPPSGKPPRLGRHAVLVPRLWPIPPCGIMFQRAEFCSTVRNCVPPCGIMFLRAEWAQLAHFTLRPIIHAHLPWHVHTSTLVCS